MNFNIKGVHYEISEATRDFISTKLEKVKYAEEYIVDLLFTLTKQSKNWKAEANVNFRWGARVHLEEEAENLHAALEKLIDKADAKISKEKAKVQDHHHDNRIDNRVEEE